MSGGEPQQRAGNQRGAPSRCVLVFDLMDTIVLDPFFARVLPRFAGALAAMREARDPECWPRFERGEIDEDAFVAGFYRDEQPELPSPELLRDLILDGYTFLPGMQALLERVRDAKGSGRPWLLSNYPCWFETARRELDLDRFFAGYVVSYQSGARKPDADAYAAAEQAIGASASELLLIDDRAENCAAARARGWDAIIFRDATTLEAALDERGLL